MHRPLIVLTLSMAVGLGAAATSSALEPPTPRQVEHYRDDGSLARRISAARRIGNHVMAPHLVSRLAELLAGQRATDQQPAGLLPATGNRRMFTLLIAFSDYPGHTDRETVDDRIFGNGAAWMHPYESLREYYRRSSYGLLEIQGSTLGWYTTPYPRRSVGETIAGRENLVREAINHFNSLGHDFTQYDSDSNGEIDYFAVVWTGPHQGWADFWWGYLTWFQDRGFRVDGKSLGVYSWQWEAWDWPDTFTPNVLIHETGHALGLPDYYDYDDAVGPRGGVGGLDMMDGAQGDHNCFSKLLLGWLTPATYNQGTQQLRLAASDATDESVLVMHGEPASDPYGEYFMVQYRRRQGNDSDLPNDGLLIWHVDATRSDTGELVYDNSLTDHKLLRLMEADGLEEIEQNLGADAGDFWTSGQVFGTGTTPCSHRYDGAPTNLEIDRITTAAEWTRLRVSLGSGCALWCEAAAPPTAWPRLPSAFDGSLEPANCQGSASIEWRFGDGSASPDLRADHVFTRQGTFSWSLSTALGDASCSRRGTTLVCTDARCWQWRQAAPMAEARGMQSVTTLEGGRVLAAGGGAGAEIYDPATSSWRATGPMAGAHPFARAVGLHDGRVLVVGSWPGEPYDTEIYDPATDVWSLTGQLANDRIFHSAAVLPDGRVLVAGGFFYSAEGRQVSLHEAEVFDPSTEAWSPAGNIGESMLVPGLTVLRNGRVLVTGSTIAQVYDPDDSSWSHLADFGADRTYHSAVSLSDGRVLLVGGAAAPSTTVYDPMTREWYEAGRLRESLNAPATVVLPSGQVLVAGGVDDRSNVSRAVAVFDPATGEWSGAASLAEGRVAHSATVLPSGSVLVIGGAIEWHEDDSFIPTNRVEEYSPPGVQCRRPLGRRQ